MCPRIVEPLSPNCFCCKDTCGMANSPAALLDSNDPQGQVVLFMQPRRVPVTLWQRAKFDWLGPLVCRFRNCPKVVGGQACEKGYVCAAWCASRLEEHPDIRATPSPGGLPPDYGCQRGRLRPGCYSKLGLDIGVAVCSLLAAEQRAACHASYRFLLGAT